jgi:hypothetical protein
MLRWRSKAPRPPRPRRADERRASVDRGGLTAAALSGRAGRSGAAGEDDQSHWTSSQVVGVVGLSYPPSRSCCIRSLRSITPLRPSHTASPRPTCPFDTVRVPCQVRARLVQAAFLSRTAPSTPHCLTAASEPRVGGRFEGHCQRTPCAAICAWGWWRALA